MSVIIAATDFSAIGDNAVQYAAGLAGQWGYNLLLVNAYFIPVTFNDPAMPIIPPDNMMEVANERMEKAAENLRIAFPNIVITSRVDYGDIEDVLEDLVEELHPLLVVSGSHGDDDTDMWMGNTTLKLLRNTKCPVLAVPPAATFRPVKQICLALDFSNPGERLPANMLGRIKQLSGASLHLLHVTKEDGETAVTNYDNVSLPTSLQSLNPAFHTAQTTGSVDEKIAEFCETKGMDWMAVIPHHHSFWDSLFHKSHTKEVIKVSHIPVLALHEENA